MRFIFILLACLICNKNIAQKSILNGRILDEVSKDLMSYVTVSIHNIDDSTLIKGVITDNSGKFKLEGFPLEKNYLLKCSFIGYQTFFKYLDFSNSNSIDLGDIFLSAKTKLLNDLEIISSTSTITYEIDKKVINVEKINTVASQTAVEVLANIPSISIDIDGNISLRGSPSFALLIDGRPSVMHSSDALQLIQASNIKDIEIITNPSAKYDAEGSSGIINIILKKNKLEGISTLININGSNSGNGDEYWNYNSDFLISINKGYFKYNIGGQLINRNRFRDIEQTRMTSIGGESSKIESNGLNHYFGKNYGLNAAMEFSNNKVDFFNVWFNVKNRQWNTANNYFFDEYINDSLINQFENRERTIRDFFVFSSSLGYQHLFKSNKDHYLSLISTYNTYDGKENAKTQFFFLNSKFIGGNLNTEVGPSSSFRISLDYQYPFKNNINLQLGSRADFAFSRDDQDGYEYTDLTEYIRLDLFSSDVKYTQNVYAGYGIINGEIKKRLGYQFGLRAEYTNRLIELTDASSNTTIDRLDWFPSAHFSYIYDDNNQFKASASRRINRPKSWHLEPFIAWEDPYTVRQGNPDLLPEYIQSYEIGFIRKLKKGSFSSETYFRKTSNVRERIQEVYDTNVIVRRPVNAGISQALGLELSLNKAITKRWSIDLGANLFYFKIKGEIIGSSLNQQTFTYRGRLSNSFNLINDLKVQLITNYVADVVTVQGIDKGYTSIDLAIKKEFFDNKIAGTLQFRNILASEVRETWIDTPALLSYRHVTPKWPLLALSISVRLNNFNSKDEINVEKGTEF